MSSFQVHAGVGVELYIGAITFSESRDIILTGSLLMIWLVIWLYCLENI